MKPDQTSKITFYGGPGMVFAPILLSIAGLIYIALQNANIPAYWTVFLIPLILCVFLAKNKDAYCQGIINGAMNSIGGILIMAVMLAGICGVLITKSGMIDTMAHYLININFLGNKFVAATFVLSCLIAFSTGTSVGTIFVVGPILYPIGYLVGATPELLVGAIVSGAAFGDNVSPVSDTLIAASSTQKVDLGGVFRTRLKYTIPVALITLILYAVLGSRGDGASSQVVGGETNPTSLLFLLIPVVVVVFCILKRHLIEALSYGILTGLILGLITQTITFSDILSIPEPFGASGLIIDGIQNSVPTVIIVMLMFAHINILQEGGGIDLILRSISKFIVGPRTAEVAIVAMTMLLNIATGLNTAAIVGAAPLAYDLGKKYGIYGYRRSNLLICSGATFNYLLPYMVPVVLGSMVSSTYAPFAGAQVVSTLQVIGSQFYPWVMLAMVIFALVTGYGRKFCADDKPKDMEKQDAQMQEREQQDTAV